jgi:membrane protease YdiL (CAAX protease family)
VSAGLVLAIALLWALSGVLSGWLLIFLVAIVLVMIVAAVLRAPKAITAGLGAIAFLVPLLAGAYAPWPLPQAVILLVLIALLRVPRMQPYATWARRGLWNRDLLKWVMVYSIVPAIALVVWRYTTSDRLERFTAVIPAVPWWAVVAGLPVYAAFNAAYEEVLFRGALMEGLDGALGAGVASIAIQAGVFGVCHYNGFPSGWVGIGLATLYGLMMGHVRRMAQGLLAAWIAHVVADTVILSLVAMMVLEGR